MSTVIRNELSKKSNLWMSKERYLELKHFCLQYPEWAEEYGKGLRRSTSSVVKPDKEVDKRDKTGEEAVRLADISEKMNLIKRCCKEVDPALSFYIFRCVTCGISYSAMNARDPVPCSKGTFYDRYRKFFLLLSQKLH